MPLPLLDRNDVSFGEFGPPGEFSGELSPDKDFLRSKFVRPLAVNERYGVTVPKVLKVSSLGKVRNLVVARIRLWLIFMF